jgi:tripartite ATP-independent transporter DctP family solute receptor
MRWQEGARVVASAAAVVAIVTVVAPVSAAEFDIRASHVESVESPLHQGWQTFAAFVESASGGRIAVSISPASQLGGLKEGLEQAKGGVIQIAQGDETSMDAFYKPMLILSTPYLFNDDEEGRMFLDSDLFHRMNDAMAKESGLRLLAAASYGFRNFTNSVKPIESVEDMKGLRIRVPPSPMSLEMVKAMGGSPTPIPWEELYGAMQQKVVDGEENPTGIVLDYSFYQVQNHLTVDQHQLGLNTMVINEAFFQSLPDDLKVVVMKGAKMAEATEYGVRNYQARVSAIEQLEAKGMEVYFPTPEQRATFRDAVVGPIRAYLEAELGAEFVAEAFATVEQGREELLQQASMQ